MPTPALPAVSACAVPVLSAWRPLVDLALAEDIGPGDITTRLAIPEPMIGQAQIEAREPVVVCGLEIAAEVFRAVDPELSFEAQRRDGEHAPTGAVLALVSGRMRSILTGERTALNFLTRLCGIATFTRRFVEAVAGTGAVIVDTRKTLPGWRVLDKYAATAGGALNHRHGLYDGILLKDNHIAAAGGVAPAVKSALAGAPAGLRVQVEVQSLPEAEAAIAAGANFLLLDNCEPARIREIADRCGDGVLLESSGGIRLENVRAHAEAGVHRVSVGAITHSAPASDLSLEVAPSSGPAGG